MEKLLEQIRFLLESGRGFDFQSHGRRNDEDYYNFALYPQHWNKGKTVYMNGNDLENIVDNMDVYISGAKGEELFGPEPEEEDEDIL